jgi:hypothetical protein
VELDAVQQTLSETETRIAALDVLEDKDGLSLKQEQLREQLREEKRQLREEKRQLREKELLLLTANAADTGTQLLASILQSCTNPPPVLIFSPSVTVSPLFLLFAAGGGGNGGHGEKLQQLQQQLQQLQQQQQQQQQHGEVMLDDTNIWRARENTPQT